MKHKQKKKTKPLLKAQPLAEKNKLKNQAALAEIEKQHDTAFMEVAYQAYSVWSVR